jgi:hypothetical protein
MDFWDILTLFFLIGSLSLILRWMLIDVIREGVNKGLKDFRSKK